MNEYIKSGFSNNDIKAIKHMKRLECIIMDGTKITDISFLNEMYSIKTIFIFCDPEYQIVDWTPLIKCKSIVIFWGGNLGVSDLSIFKDLKSLKELNLDFGSFMFSEINDISDIKYLTNLENFAIYGKDITDISDIRNCIKLETLTLHGTNATDYSAILELPNLQFLRIDKGVLTEKEIRTLKENGVEVIEKSRDEK